LALFWPRGVRAGRRRVSGSGWPPGALGRLGRERLPAADASQDRALKVPHHVVRALELIGKPLVLAERILGLLEPRLDLVDDHAESGPLGISLPPSNGAAS
jgi:hypothetical protein